MPPLVQICIVIVSLTFVAIVAMTIRAIIRLGQSAAQLTSATQVSLARVERIAQDTEEILASVGEMVFSTQRVVKRFQRLGERAADLSTAVLDEIEGPVFTAVAVARGVKTGTAHLSELLTRRVAQRRSSNNGDQNDD
jgi:uncharacterized protein YoxC